MLATLVELVAAQLHVRIPMGIVLVQQLLVTLVPNVMTALMAGIGLQVTGLVTVSTIPFDNLSEN